MKGYVFPIGSNSESVQPVEINGPGGVGVYRKDEVEGNVHFQTDDGDIDLGHHDISVSRMRPDGAPIRFTKEGDEIYLRNVDNESEVDVEYLRSDQQLEKGGITKIHDNCRVKPGYHTELMVMLETAESAGSTDVTVIKAACEGLNNAVRNSDHAAIKYGQTLLKIIEDRPLDDEEYAECVEELERELTELENSEEIRDGDQLGEERIKAIERLTSNISDVYLFNT